MLKLSKNKMVDVVYRAMEISDVKEISSLHLRSLQEGLLYNMGERYINIFYEMALKSNNCFGFVAVNAEKKIIGAAVASKNISSLIKKLMLRPSFARGLFKCFFKRYSKLFFKLRIYHCLVLLCSKTKGADCWYIFY